MGRTHVPDRRVLVVEDDRVVARVHCRYVSRQAGFVVVAVAQNGDEARERLETLRPDVMLLDLELPGHNGVALLRDLRRIGNPVEVIVVSAHASPEMVRACMQLGVVDYLVKPFWPARLGEALTALSARIEALSHGPRLDQEAVDRMRRPPAADRPSLPSSIKRDRLAAVRAVHGARGVAMTPAEVAEAVSMARVTARRYLEHLVAVGQCTADTEPDGPGRPRKVYRLWLSSPVGSQSAAAGGSRCRPPQ
jgi:response regulator of citrate/malate metabolism